MIIAAGNAQRMFALLQPKSDPSRAESEALSPIQKAAEERRAKAESALNTLRSVNSQAKKQKKAAAAQKIERLKQELQQLRMFAGGDPKALARQAALNLADVDAVLNSPPGASVPIDVAV